MASDETLIPDPVLDDRSERKRIAARIHRTIGNWDANTIQLNIDSMTDLLDYFNAVGNVSEPLEPAWSSASPAEAHITLLREIERAFTETNFRLNQVPDKVRVALLRQLGIELRQAQSATTTLRFTKTSGALGQDVTVPQGTVVGTVDSDLFVSTLTALTITAGNSTGDVQAQSSTAGASVKLPTGHLIRLTVPIAGIDSVTNTLPLAGGADAETSKQGEIRARELMRVGEHLGSSRDYEDHIYFEVLNRLGRVTAFERFNSALIETGLGYVTTVVQGSDGLAPSTTLLNSISSVVNTRHIAGIIAAVRPPDYLTFDLEIGIEITEGSDANALKKLAETNLRTRFNLLTFAFGPSAGDRYISPSDIVGQVEAASPATISVKVANDGLFAVTIKVGSQSYKSNVALKLGELPKLNNIVWT